MGVECAGMAQSHLCQMRARHKALNLDDCGANSICTTASSYPHTLALSYGRGLLA